MAWAAQPSVALGYALLGVVLVVFALRQPSDAAAQAEPGPLEEEGVLAEA